MKNDIPKGYKNYCLSRENLFTETISFDINAELLEFLKEDAKRNGLSFDCYVNYILSVKIAQLKAEAEGFSFGMLVYDFELYEEEEIIDLIQEHGQILIFDEKLEKKGVILSFDEYEKFKRVDLLN